MLAPISLAMMWARVVLPRPGGAVEDDVVQRLVAQLGGLDADGEVFLDRGLAHEFAEPAGAQGNVRVFVVRLGIAGDYAGRGFGVAGLSGGGVGQIAYPVWYE